VEILSDVSGNIPVGDLDRWGKTGSDKGRKLFLAFCSANDDGIWVSDFIDRVRIW